MSNSENYIQITPDIYQVKLPLPFALKIVNCYLLQDDGGWTVVDTGLNTPPAQKTWQATFTALGIKAEDIRQIVLTHSHPDHFGMVGWLQNFGKSNGSGFTPPVLTSPREAELARLIWVREVDISQQMISFWGGCGLPKEVEKTVLSQIDQMRELTLPHPPTIETIEPGTTLRIGRRNFQVLHTPGHSDGQILFYDSEDRLILCGDQVLIKITPNIGLWPISHPNPLGRYLASLRELAELDVRLALPGHGPLITHWHERLEELQAHHAMRLDETLAAVNGHLTPYEISRQIFDFSGLTTHEVRFAVAETLAHLELLRVQGHIKRSENGIWQYHT